ncbi:MAG: UDP-N-acetylmuramoyl-tripeptide--D-alanyl-D-alanine ligase [candidate division KSB1 bacterium]|nr:UDP-N-acetylmuramoyl-tripeptide--D-alanyl-D-alanine ligase [candidate division KSB1 bacterium]
MDIQLGELLTTPGGLLSFYGNKELLTARPAGVVIDSREVKGGEIFFALKGEQTDGHYFVKSALEKGALAAVVNNWWYQSEGEKIEAGNFLVTSDSLLALQETAHFYRSKFFIPLLAITGTTGKTTAKEMTYEVLSRKFSVLKSKGNLNNHIGVPLTLFELNQTYNIALVEMGTNHFGEIRRLTEIARPNYGLITNIGKGHLEFFGSIEGVARAKMELFESLGPEDTAFVNADDELIVQKMPPLKRVIHFSLKKQAEVKGELLGMDRFGRARFRVQNTEINLGISGVHHVYNALAAIAIGLEFGVDLASMKSALEDFRPYSKRMEIIEKQGVMIINDSYNSNPDSLRAALTVLSQMEVSGRRIAVLADMLELGESALAEHRQMGQLILELGIDYLLAYGPLATAAVDEVKKSEPKRAFHFQDKGELKDQLIKMLQPGDVVLVKGSRGMAMEGVVEEIITALSPIPDNRGESG